MVEILVGRWFTVIRKIPPMASLPLMIQQSWFYMCTCDVLFANEQALRINADAWIKEGRGSDTLKTPITNLH